VRHAAVGVTDTANLFGALEFSEKAAAAGIQPIIGCKLPVRSNPSGIRRWRAGQDRQSRHTAPLFLLCATDDGYRSLIKLVSRHYLGASGRPEPLSLEDIFDAAPGLIALTGGYDGPLYAALSAGDAQRSPRRAPSHSSAYSGTGSTSRSSAMAWTPSVRPKPAWSTSLRARSASGGDQRAVLSEGGGLRGA
jgi:DNA polymerase-3 subunit alpha